MQMVISWLEQAGGEGSAKAYTALPLQTISKQFRCLKDAIIVATNNLGQEEGKIQGRRLKYMDTKIRRTMGHHNALRPQRGLPDRSVSVLRAWLLDHFLHPYPKDTDKIVLATQTGLTRTQVSNWFINARVRLWKPMVEEMYAEEMKGQTSDDEMAGKCKHIQVPKAKEAETQDIGLNKPRNSQPPSTMNMPSLDVAMKLFASYPIVQPPYSSNGVSLTLGRSIHADNIDIRFAAHLLHDFVTSR